MAWVLAINEYHAKSKIVKPKKIMLLEKEAELNIAMAELKKAQINLGEIEKLLSALNEKFTVQMA